MGFRRRHEVIDFLNGPTCDGHRETFENSLTKMLDMEMGVMAALYKRMRPSELLRLCDAMTRLLRACILSLLPVFIDTSS